MVKPGSDFRLPYRENTGIAGVIDGLRRTQRDDGDDDNDDNPDDDDWG